MEDENIRAVSDFYDSQAEREWERMERHRMEFGISLRTLLKHLPPAPARIADIGGGPGRYAIELARRGYRITLADLSPGNVALARVKAKQAGLDLEDFRQANALDLSEFEAAGYDAVLLMGPLYHLLESGQRLQAVREARRLLRPGGVLAASFITRYAPFREAALNDPGWVFEDFSYALRLLRTGIHDKQAGFTRAHFAHVSEVQPLMAEAGLEQIVLVGCEGFCAELEGAANGLQGAQWEQWLDLNEETANDPAALAMADHLLYLGRKTN